jgi:hypothetical protein
MEFHASHDFNRQDILDIFVIIKDKCLPQSTSALPRLGLYWSRTSGQQLVLLPLQEFLPHQRVLLSVLVGGFLVHVIFRFVSEKKGLVPHLPLRHSSLQ